DQEQRRELLIQSGEADRDFENAILFGGLAAVLAVGAIAVLGVFLRRSTAALVDADRRKDEFLATLAHELRNPLAPLGNALEILHRVGPDSDRAGQARAVMDRQLKTVARLVDDLLDVSRISRGKIALRVERVDLADVVRRTLDPYRDRAPGLGLELT